MAESSMAIGSVEVYGYADGTAAQSSRAAGAVEVHGYADGFVVTSRATAPPVSDMWVGPLGLMHRMRRRADWERVPQLGTDTHTSLHGAVTTSRARQAARTTTLSWEHLGRDDASALEEIALVPARSDFTVAVVDPDAAVGNLLAPEHSRGRTAPGMPPVSVEHLYQHAGDGELAVGLVSGVRNVCVRDGGSGTSVRWLHSYLGGRGWPVMPGWPVYLSVERGNNTLANQSRLSLVFYDWSGEVISSGVGEIGSGECEADVPAGAVSVSPSMLLTEDAPGLRLVGAARMTLSPQDASRPLGNGSPVYSVTEYADTPYLPWRSASLELQEVRSHAYR